MSKSGSPKTCINLIDDPEIIRIKIRKAKIDSVGKLEYDPKRPEICNLLSIYAALDGEDPQKI